MATMTQEFCEFNDWNHNHTGLRHLGRDMEAR